jgi:hypothetical protein
VTVLCAFALLAIAGLAFDRPNDGDAVDSARGRPKWALLAVAGTLLVASLAGYEYLTYRAALAQQPYPAWLAAAPLVPILEIAPPAVHLPDVYPVLAEAFALVQVSLLAAIAYALRGAALTRALCAVLGGFALSMTVVAFASRGLTSSDLYAYLYDAAYGTAAYHPHTLSANGPFGLVGHLWSFRMLPAAYGPVWLDVAHALAGSPGNMAQHIFVLRILSAISFAAVLGALAALRVPAAFLGLVALDPAIPYQYVADGHNDLFGIALLLWATVAATRGFLAPALALAVLAGASKISFAAIAPLAFASLSGMRRRVVWGALAVVGSAAVSLALAGPAYPHALAQISTIFPTSGEPGGAFVPRLTTLFALALVVAAVVYRRTGWPGAWAFVALGSVPFPWYLGWGLPYLVLDARRAVPFLVLFPLVAFAMTTTYAPTWAWYPLAIAFPVAAALLVYTRWHAVWAERVSARSCARPVPALEGRLGGG